MTDEPMTYEERCFVAENEARRLRAALERIAALPVTDNITEAVLNGDRSVRIAHAALAGGDRFPCHMEREHYFRCKRPCGHPRCASNSGVGR